MNEIEARGKIKYRIANEMRKYGENKEEYEDLEIALQVMKEIREYRAMEERLNGISVKQVVDGFVKQVENETQEEYNNGWISCSERLPEVDGKGYLVQKTNGFIDILDFTKDAYKLDRYDFAEYKGKKKSIFFDYDSEYGYIEWECEAWMPLPSPYQKGSDV